MKRQIFLGTLMIVVLVGVGYLTRYEYFKVGRGDGIDLQFRTNRYTNETDALYNGGWEVIQTPKQWADLHWNKTHPIDPLPEPIPVSASKESK